MKLNKFFLKKEAKETHSRLGDPRQAAQRAPLKGRPEGTSPKRGLSGPQHRIWTQPQQGCQPPGSHRPPLLHPACLMNPNRAQLSAPGQGTPPPHRAAVPLAVLVGVADQGLIPRPGREATLPVPPRGSLRPKDPNPAARPARTGLPCRPPAQGPPHLRAAGGGQQALTCCQGQVGRKSELGPPLP